MEELEAQFHRAMLNVYDAATHLKPPYHPTYFRRMVHELGGLGAARTLLAKKEVSEGFSELYLRGKRLDLSVEYLALQHPWGSLFTDSERDIARKRLEDVQFAIPE